jgi:hypothetical protein
LVTFIWCLVIALGDSDLTFHQVVRAHKSEERVIENMRWWSRSRNSDREAWSLQAT